MPTEKSTVYGSLGNFKMLDYGPGLKNKQTNRKQNKKTDKERKTKRLKSFIPRDMKSTSVYNCFNSEFLKALETFESSLNNSTVNRT